MFTRITNKGGDTKIKYLKSKGMGFKEGKY